ncbi:hypothetical protein LSTR_LSTR015504 [Laodelphax striatellus]|uniref:Uncharacterized protein n=1 Tax=Laodelphax striatellus TaxID=195883 RepID=A0A482WTC0_LAOST|nr:hypothetical protein LSTR_LSTR015504 [Laodelphax striatellus]
MTPRKEGMKWRNRGNQVERSRQNGDRWSHYHRNRILKNECHSVPLSPVPFQSRSVKSGKDLKCHFACAPAFIKKRARCKLLLLLLLLLLQRCCSAREKRQTCRSLALSLSAKCCRR